MTAIRDEAHLKVVPEGTIISWLRIPGDPTSEAVAFVRRQIEAVSPEAGRPFDVTVWVSPGGWEPQTIESAGVTFPCQVIRWGEFDMDAVPASALPLLTETLAECNHGGTWAREKALECASRVFLGLATHGGVVDSAAVMSMADHFEAWLDPSTPWPKDVPAFADDDCGLGQTAEDDDPEIRQAGAAYGAWLDPARAADGDPTEIVRGDL